MARLASKRLWVRSPSASPLLPPAVAQTVALFARIADVARSNVAHTQLLRENAVIYLLSRPIGIGMQQVICRGVSVPRVLQDRRVPTTRTIAAYASGRDSCTTHVI